MPLFGKAFLTSAYLMVNQDKGEFTLWQSNATMSQRLVAAGPSSTCTSTSTAASSSNTSSHSHAVSPGAIAGATVGVALVAIIIGCGFWLRSMHRRNRAEAATSIDHPDKNTGDLQQNLTSETQPPQELPNSLPKPHELWAGEAG